MLYLSYSLVSLCLNSVSYAGGWAGFEKIHSLYQRECAEGRYFEINLTSDYANPDSCPSGSTKRVNLSCFHPAYEKISNMALTTFIADREVDFWLSGCDEEGQP